MPANLKLCLILLLLTNCTSQKKSPIVGFWELTEIQPSQKDIFKSLSIAIESNSKYRFEEETNLLKITLMNKGKISKVIDGKYEVYNDTLRLYKEFDTGETNIEVYQIQELDQYNLKLFEYSTKDVRIFKREIE